jgi:hypothetical protein
MDVHQQQRASHCLVPFFPFVTSPRVPEGNEYLGVGVFAWDLEPTANIDIALSLDDTEISRSDNPAGLDDFLEALEGVEAGEYTVNITVSLRQQLNPLLLSVAGASWPLPALLHISCMLQQLATRWFFCVVRLGKRSGREW